jgi:DNA-binding MarR family transcriptional regulator/catechol 2,3-dioxygenase-like lactoylglutathione lyase family enzyme
MRRALEEAGYDDIPKDGLYVIGGLALADVEHPLSSLIAELRLSKQAAGQLVDTLVTRGYLHRSVDTTDRRKLNVGLTERGRAAATVAAEARLKVDGELQARVKPEDVDHARRVLLALIEIGREPKCRDTAGTAGAAGTAGMAYAGGASGSTGSIGAMGSTRSADVFSKRPAMDRTGTRDSLSIEDANLSESRFTNVKLAKSAFDDVNLKGSTFTNVNLAGAALTDVNLADVVIKDANVKGLSINGLLFSELIRAHLRRTRIVLYAKNLARMQEFYRSLLDLEVEQAQSDHVLLRSTLLELVIVQIPESIASTVDIAVPPRRRSGTPIKLVFDVMNLGATRASARVLGGEVDPSAQEWTSEGYRICDGQDPEGNVVQFRQREI